MPIRIVPRRWVALAAAAVAASATLAATPPATPPAKPPAAAPDLSGKKRVGTASFYARKLAGRKMADGTPLDPSHDVAASKTLPLGTRARVTNLANGRSAVVTIKDRGPYAKGRIVDLSPAAAAKVGITPKKGTARVEVTPIEVPQPDGSVKAGEATP